MITVIGLLQKIEVNVKKFNMNRIILWAFGFLVIGLTGYGQSADKKLIISHLTGDFYIYTTFNTYQEDQVPAHGMYLVTDTGVVMFDTPWDTIEFQPPAW